MKLKFSTVIECFGFFYLLVNTIVFMLIVFLSFDSVIHLRDQSGIGMAFFPLLGITAGYWIRKRNLGWFKKTIIGISVFLTVVFILFVFFILPKIPI